MKLENFRVLVKSGAIVEIVSENRGWIKVLPVVGEAPDSVRAGWLRELTAKELTKYAPVELPAKSGGPVAGEPEAEPNSGKVIEADLGHYTRHKTKTACGRGALDINDEAANILRGQDISDCYFIVAKHMAQYSAGGHDVKADDAAIDKAEADLKAMYAHLNAGMQRMNLGNRLRKLMGTYGNINAHKTARKAA